MLSSKVAATVICTCVYTDQGSPADEGRPGEMTRATPTHSRRRPPRLAPDGTDASPLRYDRGWSIACSARTRLDLWGVGVEASRVGDVWRTASWSFGAARSLPPRGAVCGRKWPGLMISSRRVACDRTLTSTGISSSSRGSRVGVREHVSKAAVAVSVCKVVFRVCVAGGDECCDTLSCGSVGLSLMAMASPSRATSSPGLKDFMRTAVFV
jgi:hypothetical protein